MSSDIIKCCPNAKSRSPVYLHHFVHELFRAKLVDQRSALAPVISDLFRFRCTLQSVDILYGHSQCQANPQSSNQPQNVLQRSSNPSQTSDHAFKHVHLHFPQARKLWWRSPSTRMRRMCWLVMKVDSVILAKIMLRSWLKKLQRSVLVKSGLWLLDAEDVCAQLPQDIRWHFIGTLQSKKVKDLAGW